MLRDQELVCNLLVVNLALKAGKMGEIMLRFEGKGHAGFLFFGDFLCFIKVGNMIILNTCTFLLFSFHFLFSLGNKNDLDMMCNDLLKQLTYSFDRLSAGHGCIPVPSLPGMRVDLQQMRKSTWFNVAYPRCCILGKLDVRGFPCLKKETVGIARCLVHTLEDMVLIYFIT